jgi:hypothetical protein
MPPYRTASSRSKRLQSRKRGPLQPKQVPVTSNIETHRPVIVPVGSDHHLVTVVRSFDAGSYAGSLIADATGALSFTLSQLPNVSELTTLFDQYRVERLEYTFYPSYTMGTPANTSTCIITAIDYDDATVPASVGALYQYENAQTRSGYIPFTESFKPHVAMAAYSGAFTSYANRKSQWIDSASTGVIHYGLKFVIPQNFTAANTWRVIGKALVSLKNVR